MQQNVNFITVATADLDGARSFYRALGWRPVLDVEGEVIFYQTAPGQVLGFFQAEKFDADLGLAGQSPVSGFTLAHNVDSRDEVVALVEEVSAAGGTVLKPPQPSQFGGIFHAHVRDPNGLIWEIAHNPAWRVNSDGSVHLG